MKTCAKLCNECPFSNKSTKGFLGSYTVDDIIGFFRHEVLFPCHKTLTDVNESRSVELVHTDVIKGKYPICRGYVEMMIKSCKLPRDPLFAALIKECKSSLSTNSMSLHEFKEHHTWKPVQNALNQNTSKQ